VNVDELEVVVRRTLAEIAPDVDPAGVDASADFHDELGLDSMDLLNLAIGLHEATGIDIPEVDAARIECIADCVSYLHAHGAG
jgi:acyl carrier protein